MKIAYVSNGTPFDKRSFSGSSYFALRELQRRYGDVSVVDTPVFDRQIAHGSRLHRFGFHTARSTLVTWAYARLLAPRLEAIRPDVVVFVESSHKVLSFLDRYPCILVADILVGPLLDFYPSHRSISARGRRIADEQERTILVSRAPYLLSSDWAAESAAAYYGVPKSRFVVAPFGPNMEEIPDFVERPIGGPLRLLFAALDWERKGGDIALAAFRRIRLQAPDAEFHVVGCRPPVALETPGVVVHGRLNKNDPQQAEKLACLFRDASFFLMPSRAEASAIVYNEACAYGAPPVASDTGGTGTLVRDGENGLLLPYDAPPDAYADAILAVWQNPDRYQTMCRTARTAFETRLNWREWGKTLDAELRSVTRSGFGRSSSTSAGALAAKISDT